MHKNVEYQKVDIITTTQNLSDVYADLGSEINVRGYDTMMLYLQIDINTCSDVTVMPLAKLVEGATAEYCLPLQVVGTAEINVDKQVYELNYDADGYQCIKIDVKGAMVIQLQAKATLQLQVVPEIEAAYAILVND